jgi:predicted nucleic acid-binding protein
MNANVFVDTCVLTYAFVEDDPRHLRALEILVAGGIISVQVLNELANICRKKLRMDWKETAGAVSSVRSFCFTTISLTPEIHVSGMRIAQRYNFSVYDGMILAAALEAGCTTLLTEDLQHGQMIDGLRIVNPFLGS